MTLRQGTMLAHLRQSVDYRLICRRIRAFGPCLGREQLDETKMNHSSTIIVCRDGEGLRDRQDFENTLLKRLAGQAGRPVLVVPHLYYLTADHQAAKHLAAVEGSTVVAAWLYPRATQWTLAALGCKAEAGPVAVDLRGFESPEVCADALIQLAGGAADAARGQVEEIGGAVTSRWYPVIDYSLCTSCGQCRDFCLFGVYSVNSVDDGGKVVPAEPDNCKPGCPACSRVCPAGAIMFPHYEADPAIAGAGGVIGETGGPAAAAGVAPVEAIGTAMKERASCAGCSSSAGGDAQSVCLPGQTCDCDCDSSEDCCPDGASQPCDCNCAAPRDELDDLIDDLDRLDDS